MKNHYDRIIAFMEAHGSITPMEAFRELGETKLSTRIGEMRRKGVEIEQERETGTNRHGQTVRYMRYRLAEKKNVAGSVVIQN